MSALLPIASRKAAARVDAQPRRAAAADAAPDAAAASAAHVLEWVGAANGLTISAYLPIGDELDPRPAMAALREAGARICVPVIEGKARPLSFRLWTHEARLAPGPFGVPVPENTPTVTPDLVIAPLLAFDATCHRLGYGGGFYDRTLEALRAVRPLRAAGFAYAAQQVDAVPREATDARLDAVITEKGALSPEVAP